MQSNTEWNGLTTLAEMATEKLVSPSATRLTEKILGWNSEQLVDILHELAFELNLSHISVLSLTTNKSWDISVLTSVSTYSKEWQTRYFLKRYGEIDPVLKRASTAVLPFDWADLEIENRTVSNSLRCYSARDRMPRSVNSRPKSKDHTLACVVHKRHAPAGLGELQIVEHAIPSAIVCFDRFRCELWRKQPKSDVQLSPREEECLVWAGRGKTHQEIAGILGIGSGSVKSYLDLSHTSSAVSM